MAHPPRPGSPHVEAANRYIKDVLSGRIPACRYVRLACERQRDELKKAKTKAFPFRFDNAAAERVCRFLEKLPHIKGPLARKNVRLKLEAWQCFAVTTAYGWLHKDGRLKGKRRFRMLYLEVPRGNGKSALLSGLSIYALCADKENGAEVYSAAVTRDQAKIIFDTARDIVRKLRPLREKMGLRTVKNAITQERTASTFKPLASDEDSLEGLNIHFAAIDELHAHKKRAVYDVVESGMGKREQPMLVVITTAGSDRAGICYEVRSYIVKILEGTAPSDTTFGLIYTIDRDELKTDVETDEKGDDWQIEETWRKANPNWAVSVDPVHIANMAAKALQMPSALANFLTKHLNVWVNADTAWMDMGAWNKCTDTTLHIDDFEGEKPKVGLDLASKIDIASRVTLFTRKIDEVDHYYLFGKHYLNEAACEDGRNSQYEGWRTGGRLVVTPGDVTDFGAIEKDLKDDAARFPMEVAYDPWQATQMAQNLQVEGIPTVEFRNTVGNFSAPMKEIDALVREGRLHHDGCPIMTWMISNVVCHRDAKDNIYPRKERPENKIDGVIALITAMGRALIEDENGGGGSIYDNPALWSDKNGPIQPKR